MNGKKRHEVASRIALRGWVPTSVFAAALACAGLGFGQSPSAQVRSTTRPGSAAAKISSTSQPSPKGQPEGIKVHGHWIIEVKNPDGKVTARREFENHIVLYGQGILEGMLSGDIAPGGWSIFLAGSASNSGPQCSESAFASCSIAGLALEQGATYGSFNVSTCTASQGCSLNLVRSFVPPTAPPPATGPNGYFQLSGSVPMVESGVANISLVATYLMSCSNAQITAPLGGSFPGNVPSIISPGQCEPTALFTQLGGELGLPSITSTSDPLNGSALTSGSVPLFPTGAPFTAFTFANPNSTPPPAPGTPTEVPVSPGQSVSVTVQMTFQ
jgi:hypothetical protein